MIKCAVINCVENDMHDGMEQFQWRIAYNILFHAQNFDQCQTEMFWFWFVYKHGVVEFDEFFWIALLYGASGA